MTRIRKIGYTGIVVLGLLLAAVVTFVSLRTPSIHDSVPATTPVARSPTAADSQMSSVLRWSQRTPSRQWRVPCAWRCSNPPICEAGRGPTIRLWAGAPGGDHGCHVVVGQPVIGGKTVVIAERTGGLVHHHQLAPIHLTRQGVCSDRRAPNEPWLSIMEQSSSGCSPTATAWASRTLLFHNAVCLRSLNSVRQTRQRG